jgi:2-C-methyl-D-erythritol 2,4-cyclodiphosphate synthase
MVGIPRVGIGVDSHRLVAGRRLVLGGVEIPSDRGLDGHSDADVVSHAITDAILGALALGNIGTHFPNTDPGWRDADSTLFLARARDLAAERGYAVGNLDVTVIAEAPRIAPHVARIRARLVEALQMPVEGISVKATTAEGMGALGRGEGMTCLAVVLLAPHGS